MKSLRRRAPSASATTQRHEFARRLPAGSLARCGDGFRLCAVTFLAAWACTAAEMPPSSGVVVPVLPALWRVPASARGAIDYAQSVQADAWLRHPILGDPSFDAFERAPGNPLVRGTAPFLWPVNVFLFDDPRSGNLFGYVGHYLDGYAIGPGKPPAYCRVYRSEKSGGAWKDLGPIFNVPDFRFTPDEQPASVAPDVSVVFDGGRYHMAYDWATADTTWENASAPSGGADSGVAYAWAEKPEGPFVRETPPILRTSELQRLFPCGGKYCRAYGTTLVRRARDWLVLTDVDSGPYFAWGQVALTAADPKGPWSFPVLVVSLEGERYFPSPVEAFPGFVHDGYIYNPLTSVGATRNFQVIYRAKLEDAHRPGAWELFAHGSLWHAEPVAHEGFGIWGQTFSGAVDAQGVLRVLFPSRDWPGSMGTISAAARPWDRPFKERGFVLSAHSGPSLTVTRAAYRDFALEAELEARGTSVRIAWGCGAPLGFVGRADGRADPIGWTRQNAVELSAEAWRVLEVSESTEPAGVRVLAKGTLGADVRRTLSLAVGQEGAVELALDGARVFQGRAAARTGPLGLILEPGTHVGVARFAVTGVPLPAVHTWLAREAFSGAGADEARWRVVASPAFRFGTGFISRAPGERLKWNFRGKGFRLWLPRGPEYGSMEARIDGVPAGKVDAHASVEGPSSVVLAREDLEDGFHALVLRGSGGLMPVDCLEAIQ